MMTDEQVVAVYEEMSVLTAQMLVAAREGDWDRLVVLERDFSAHVQSLQENALPHKMQNHEIRSRKIELLRQLLDDDRKIRDLTTPWLAKLSALINNTGTERRLAHAYGAV